MPVAVVSFLKRELDREGEMIDSSTMEEHFLTTERGSSLASEEMAEIAEMGVI